MTINIMLDLETLSTEPDAAIVSIGLCTFGHEGDWNTTYYTIDASSSIASGGHVSGETLKWWMAQNDQARREIAQGGETLGDVLEYLEMWLGSIRDAHGGVTLWGNGANFDNVVLRRAYERLRMPTPWSYREDRCFRTLRNLFPHVPAPSLVPSDIKHHALHDAIAQAHHAEAIFKAMRMPDAA